METNLGENNCQIIAETAAAKLTHFGICFRRKNAPPDPDAPTGPAEIDDEVLALWVYKNIQFAGSCRPLSNYKQQKQQRLFYIVLFPL